MEKSLCFHAAKQQITIIRSLEPHVPCWTGFIKILLPKVSHMGETGGQNEMITLHYAVTAVWWWDSNACFSWASLYLSPCTCTNMQPLERAGPGMSMLQLCISLAILHASMAAKALSCRIGLETLMPAEMIVMHPCDDRDNSLCTHLSDWDVVTSNSSN